MQLVGWFEMKSRLVLTCVCVCRDSYKIHWQTHTYGFTIIFLSLTNAGYGQIAV